MKKLEFILPAGVYLLASGLDYLATAHGLETNSIKEINPIYNDLVNNFGIYKGLAIGKLSLTTGILGGLWEAENKKIKNFKFKSKYILYPGAIITGLTGLSWLI